MEIETKIEKLLQQYSQKIDDCDKLLETVRTKRTEARQLMATDMLMVLSKEFAVIHAQRQAYLQASVDIESLKGFIEVQDANT